MELWIWQNFSMRYPDNWEMLQYSRNVDSGRCALADRYQFRLEFNWRRFDAPPDFDRMLSDYGSQLRGKKKGRPVRPVVHGSWRGLESEHEQRTVGRFGRYFQEAGCLIEIVLIWPDHRDQALTRAILQSVRHISPSDGTARWRAFGMDMRVDKQLVLNQCRVEPARALMVFADPKRSTHRQSCHRLGMVEHWLTGSVEQWIKGQLPGRSVEHRWSADARNGHDVQMVQFIEPSHGLARLVRRPVHRCAAAWICPADRRLYSIDCKYPKGEDLNIDQLAGHQLSCCERLGNKS